MVSQPINGIIPFETDGFPNGAGSAKEAVMAQIKNENAEQNDINQKFGGSNKIKRKSNKRVSLKRKSNKRKSNKRVSLKRKSNKKKSNKRMSNKRVSFKSVKLNKKLEKMFYGGLEGGEEVTVPQFPSSNTSGPLNPNVMSANFNSVLLQTKQDSIHDKKINE
jgi:hypothetical protein